MTHSQKRFEDCTESFPKAQYYYDKTLQQSYAKINEHLDKIRIMIESASNMGHYHIYYGIHKEYCYESNVMYSIAQCLGFHGYKVTPECEDLSINEGGDFRYYYISWYAE